MTKHKILTVFKLYLKIFCVVVLLFVFVNNAKAFAAAVYINDKNSYCEGIILNERVMVPIRGVFEKLGYNVSWNENTKTALLVNKENTITIRNGSKYIYVNARAVMSDVPQIIIDGKMYVPLRLISEAISAEVIWDNNNKSVNIITPEKIITLDEISKSNTLEYILSKYQSISVRNIYKSVESSEITDDFEISFGKDENGRYIYMYSDSSGLKRLMCYEGEFSISPDGRTMSVFFKTDEDRNNAVMSCYNYMASNIMIAYSENGTSLSVNKLKDSYKADVTVTIDQSSPTYGVWAQVWGIKDKKFDICYEYILDKETLVVLRSDIFCSLSDGRFDVGETILNYDKEMTIPDEFKPLIENADYSAI